MCYSDGFGNNEPHTNTERQGTGQGLLQPGDVAPLTVGDNVVPLTVGNIMKIDYEEDFVMGVDLVVDAPQSTFFKVRRAASELWQTFQYAGETFPAEVIIRSGEDRQSFGYETLFSNPTFKPIIKVLAGMSVFMAVKNLKYGNSALDPKRIFSKTNIEEQILIRLDDKLSRIEQRKEPGLAKNDVIDIMGYLILYCIHKEWFDYSDLLD